MRFFWLLHDILLIPIPVLWILPDVRSHLRQLRIVTNNVLVVIALPDVAVIAAGEETNASGDGALELVDDRWKRIRDGFGKCTLSRGIPSCPPKPWRRRAACPYGARGIFDDENSMHVIRHHHPCIQDNVWSYLRRLFPFVGNDCSAC